MSINPYQAKQSYAFWKKSVSSIPKEEFDPVVTTGFKISRDELISTAGSCFAQHIAREVRERGFNYHVTEKPHPLVPSKIFTENSYGIFSARYGNIYTAKQLLQLFKRSFSLIKPDVPFWCNQDGQYLDPFRPQIQAKGFFNPEDLYADTNYHLSCVRKMFESTNVFIFTLGLTEGWETAGTGYSFPICPALFDQDFSFDKYCFVNYTVNEVVDHLTEFVTLLRQVNSSVKIILTVSPVPLVATYTDDHVAVATTYSKSVLRVAASEVCRKYPLIDYFPSFEIINCNFNRGTYFEDDLRGVTAEGVNHVMNLFFKHYMDSSSGALNSNFLDGSIDNSKFVEASARIAKASCDEELLDF